MTSATMAATNCSKWYGQIIGLSNLNWSAKGNIIGLLGPNGAGKSTLIKLLCGLIKPSHGTVRVLGDNPRQSLEVRRQIGYCPEHDSLYNEMTALEMVTILAKLSGLGKESRARAETSLEQVGLADVRHRRVGGFSRGMRQRTKLAQCLVHDPKVLILDEPLIGVDPLARSTISNLIRTLGNSGKTVLLSTHVLYELEALTKEIVIIYRGQILAEGNLYKIRELIDKHPHRIRVECDTPRVLATELVRDTHVASLELGTKTLTVKTTHPDFCYRRITELVAQNNISVTSLTSPDNNLSAVFAYLTDERP